MADLIQRSLRRIWAGLTTWPNARHWQACAAISAVVVGCMAVVGFSGGLYHFTATQPDLVQRMILVLFVPALGEELVFRGALPSLHEGVSARWPLRASVVLYTLWHVVEALTFLPNAASVFLRPDFLLCCAVLGLGCAMMRHITGSLWPAVILHWAVVVVWQTWLGGVSALG